MSMLGAKGSDEIPAQLLKELESLHLSSAGGRTWGAWFWHNLPPASRDLYQLDDTTGCKLLDLLKFNKQIQQAAYFNKSYRYGGALCCSMS